MTTAWNTTAPGHFVVLIVRLFRPSEGAQGYDFSVGGDGAERQGGGKPPYWGAFPSDQCPDDGGDQDAVFPRRNDGLIGFSSSHSWSPLYVRASSF